eukprot:2610182-Amphidinium_carterae.1
MRLSGQTSTRGSSSVAHDGCGGQMSGKSDMVVPLEHGQLQMHINEPIRRSSSPPEDAPYCPYMPILQSSS